MAELFFNQDSFNDTNVHIEQAKSLAVNHPYNLGRVMELQARFWYRQRRFEHAKSEALGAIEVFEKHRAARDLERCNDLLRKIDSEQR